MLIIKKQTARLLPLPIRLSFLALFVAMTFSHGFAQDRSYAFSQSAPEQASVFHTTNPYTKSPGSMTITYTALFDASRLSEPSKLGIFYISGQQSGSFTFMPDDPSQPTISGTYQFALLGETEGKNNLVDFHFRMDGRALDGTPVTFLQREKVFISESGIEIKFGGVRALEPGGAERPDDNQ